MATSSITANFAVKDPVEARRFVTALLSTDRPARKPFGRPTLKFVSGVENLRRQIARARSRG